MALADQFLPHQTPSSEKASGQESWASRYEREETLKLLRLAFALSLLPSVLVAAIAVTATKTALRDLRYNYVSIVNRGFKAKGTIAPFLVAANSGSEDKS